MVGSSEFEVKKEFTVLRKWFYKLVDAEKKNNDKSINEEKRILRNALPILERILNDKEAPFIFMRKMKDTNKMLTTTEYFLEFLRKIVK